MTWLKPGKPRTIDTQTYHTFPDSLTIRECRVNIEQPVFRVKTLTLATTLLDADAFTTDDLAQLYRRRWDAELDLRSLKQTLQMDHLRCKTPELVRKEIWTHILAYNLIRTSMAQAAIRHDIEPRTISFKGTLQTLATLQHVIAILGEHNRAFREQLYQQLLDTIVVHRVADRPNRFEPRKVKHINRAYETFKKPRYEHKRDLLKGVREN